MTTQVASLVQIEPDKIIRNPENPRLIFREPDMNALLESIQEVGIQVPLSVYWDETGKTYVILDGERRWRCSMKLNLHEVPAIVQAQPTRLENILMMFNIHNVRVAWDPLPMAMKLELVRTLLEEEGKPNGVQELAGITGLRPVEVRRAFELLRLPERYRELLLSEAEKPRSERTITADLFVEIYKSWHAIERWTPEISDEISEGDYVDAMVDKYRSKVVDNMVHFRDVSKIARAELAGESRDEAIPILRQLIGDPDYSIKDAYDDSVREAYEERDLLTRIRSLMERLEEFRTRGVAGEIRAELNALGKLVREIVAES